MRKLGGKSVKFSGSAFPYKKPPPALTGDKQSKEFVLTMVFAHALHYNGVKITKIEVNEDDSHGKPDTIIVANGEEVKIQLTKISMNDPLRRMNIAERQTNELLNLISEEIDIPKPINVYIYLNSNNKNAIPKGNQKEKKKLAQLIAAKIEEERENIFGENPKFVGFAVEDSELKKLANSITINPVNAGYFSTFKGRNGIHINYEFDIHDWNEEDLDREIERIVKSKETGQQDLLLIWADRFELLYQDEEVSRVLVERFSKTSFKDVYFLAIFDRVDMFVESWRIRKIK